MDREELAARIFAVSCYKGGQPCSDSFAQADKFLAYAARQRKAKGVESTTGKPDERVAREFILAVGDNGEIRCMNSKYLVATEGKAQKWEYITVKEILPGDEQ